MDAVMHATSGWEGRRERRRRREGPPCTERGMTASKECQNEGSSGSLPTRFQKFRPYSTSFQFASCQRNSCVRPFRACMHEDNGSGMAALTLRCSSEESYAGWTPFHHHHLAHLLLSLHIPPSSPPDDRFQPPSSRIHASSSQPTTAFFHPHPLFPCTSTPLSSPPVNSDPPSFFSPPIILRFIHPSRCE